MSTLQPVINGLWIGSQLSRMELLTVRSFLAHGHPFHLWAYQPITTPLPDGCVLRDACEIMPATEVFRYGSGGSQGSYAGFSDIWRFKFLRDVGGWYVDMDVCCLKPFDFAQDTVLRMNRFNGDPTANIIRLPRRTAFAADYYEQAHALVTAENLDFYLPLSLLGVLVAKHHMQQYFVPFDVFSNTAPTDQVKNGVPARTPAMRELERVWLRERRNIGELYKSQPLFDPGPRYAIHWGNERTTREFFDKNKPPASSVYAALLEKYAVEPL